MQPTDFVATLVFQANGSRHLEQSAYRAVHPELAWRMAMADGAAGRYGRTFVGVASLEATEDLELGVTVEEGDGTALVGEKAALAAFNDDRWVGVACDQAELARFSAAPAYVMEVEGLDAVRWQDVTHAYGPATDVPRNLRRLASPERWVREAALEELFAMIVHQGSIYSATAVAVPFIVRSLTDTRMPDRGTASKLIERIAEGLVDAEGPRRGWFARLFGAMRRPVAADDRGVTLALREALTAQREELRKLASDEDLAVASAAASALQHLGP